VGATDSGGALAKFSNHDAGMGVTAPGVGILSTVPGNSYEKGGALEVFTRAAGGSFTPVRNAVRVGVCWPAAPSATDPPMSVRRREPTPRAVADRGGHDRGRPSTAEDPGP